MAREAGLFLVPGQMGGGKSWTTNKNLKKSVVPNYATGKQPTRVLILDINDEYSEYRAIAVKDVKEWCLQGRIEIRRVRIWHTDGPKKGRKMSLDEIAETLQRILEVFHRGKILVEDITKYVTDAIPGDLIGEICTMRHSAVDMILHFQTWGKIGHPKLFGNASYIRAHKCGDTVERHKNKFDEYAEPLKIMECLINKQYYAGNVYFFCWLDKKKKKIFADEEHPFTREQFIDAVDDYMGKNYNIVKDEVNRMNIKTGRKMYATNLQAINTLRARLIKDYYGNPV